LRDQLSKFQHKSKAIRSKKKQAETQKNIAKSMQNHAEIAYPLPQLAFPSQLRFGKARRITDLGFALRILQRQSPSGWVVGDEGKS
jgi:hypothetical protein